MARMIKEKEEAEILFAKIAFVPHNRTRCRQKDW